MPDDEVVVTDWQDQVVRRWFLTTASSRASEIQRCLWDSGIVPTTGAYATYTLSRDGRFEEAQLSPEAVQLLEEQRAERQREHDREYEAMEAEAQQAEARARRLLDSLLSEDQRRSLAERGYIEVVVGSVGGRYRIVHGTNGNVRLLDDDGDEIAGLCAHPDLPHFDDRGRYVGELPWENVAAGQILALTTDERGFYKVANVHWCSPAGVEVIRRLVLPAQPLDVE